MPPIIEVAELSKEFRTFRRRPGVMGALQNLFVREYVTVHAVDRVSFTIDAGEMVGYIGDEKVLQRAHHPRAAAKGAELLAQFGDFNDGWHRSLQNRLS